MQTPEKLANHINDEPPPKTTLGKQTEGDMESKVACLALEWRLFDYSFDGDFNINDIPIYLDSPNRYSTRSTTEQQHGDTGFSVWDASVVLARYIESNIANILGSRKPKCFCPGESDITTPCSVILELGSGRGLVGLAAAAASATISSTEASDSSAFSGENHREGYSTKYLTVLSDLPYCLSQLKDSLQQNTHFAREVPLPNFENLGSILDTGNGSNIKSPVSVIPLDWEYPEQSLLSKLYFKNVKAPPIRLLLAADTVWVASLVEPFVRTLHFFLDWHSNDSQYQPFAIIAHQTRSEIIDAKLFSTLECFGLAFEYIPFASDACTSCVSSNKIRIYLIESSNSK